MTAYIIAYFLSFALYQSAKKMHETVCSWVLSISKPYTNFEEIVLVKIGLADFSPIHKICTCINHICPSSKICISLTEVGMPFQPRYISFQL